MKVIAYRICFIIIGFCLGCSLSSAATVTPIIVITNLPAYGTYGANCFISGYVTNANTVTNALLVCNYWPNENPNPTYDKKLSPFGWFSLPAFTNQLTKIQADGTWSCNVPSNIDQYATEYAVMLVPTNFNLAAVNAQDGLPTADINASEAIVYADRADTSRRQINWSGYGWWVKTAGSDGNEFLAATGPGPNDFSDSPTNAWVDAQGLLHLQITHPKNGWECVELFSDESFGYGQYRCTLNANISNLDANVIFSMFTWSDDTDYNDREIDMEVSRWDYAFGSNDVEDYAVAPYNTGQTLRFGMPPYVTNSTHSFVWTPTNVFFQTLNGNYDPSPPSSNILQNWNCSVSPIPPQGGENALLILWLDGGGAPVSGQPVQVTLSQFEYVPIDPQQPAVLSQSVLQNNQFHFTVQGANQAHYQVLSSSNVINWSTNESSIRATNGVYSSSPLSATFQFTDSNPPSATSSFYRVLTEP